MGDPVLLGVIISKIRSIIKCAGLSSDKSYRGFLPDEEKTSLIKGMHKTEIPPASEFLINLRLLMPFA